MLPLGVIMVERSWLVFDGHGLQALLPVCSPRLLRARPLPQVIASIGVFIATMPVNVGVMACGVGMLLGLPMSCAAMTHLVGLWSRVVAGIPPR